MQKIIRNITAVLFGIIMISLLTAKYVNADETNTLAQLGTSIVQDDLRLGLNTDHMTGNTALINLGLFTSSTVPVTGIEKDLAFGTEYQVTYQSCFSIDSDGVCLVMQFNQDTL
jgi:hypothetical protein